MGWRARKEIMFGPNGPRLHPRASFAEYAESVKGRCQPWSKFKLTTTTELCDAILELL